MDTGHSIAMNKTTQVSPNLIYRLKTLTKISSYFVTNNKLILKIKCKTFNFLKKMNTQTQNKDSN